MRLRLGASPPRSTTQGDASTLVCWPLGMTRAGLDPGLSLGGTELAQLSKPLRLNVELEEEPESGRWIADVVDLPGVMVYGSTAFEALAKAKLLAIEVVGDRLAQDEDPLTGCELGETCPPFDVAANFGGIEFSHRAVAC